MWYVKDKHFENSLPFFIKKYRNDIAKIFQSAIDLLLECFSVWPRKEIKSKVAKL